MTTDMQRRTRWGLMVFWVGVVILMATLRAPVAAAPPGSAPLRYAVFWGRKAVDLNEDHGGKTLGTKPELKPCVQMGQKSLHGHVSKIELPWFRQWRSGERALGSTARRIRELPRHSCKKSGQG
jgi:hypothetical protein